MCVWGHLSRTADQNVNVETTIKVKKKKKKKRSSSGKIKCTLDEHRKKRVANKFQAQFLGNIMNHPVLDETDEPFSFLARVGHKWTRK